MYCVSIYVREALLLESYFSVYFLQSAIRQSSPLPAEADNKTTGEPSGDDVYPRGQARTPDQVVPRDRGTQGRW